MSIFLQTNGAQAKAWVKLMQEADDGDGTLTYEAKTIWYLNKMMTHYWWSFDDDDDDDGGGSDDGYDYVEQL